MSEVLNGIWEDSLVFGSTEVASQFGGYLEGALEAAENAFSRVAAKEERKNNRKPGTQDDLPSIVDSNLEVP